MSFFDLLKAHLAATAVRAAGEATKSVAKDIEAAGKTLQKRVEAIMPPEPEGYDPKPPKRETITVDAKVVTGATSRKKG